MLGLAQKGQFYGETDEIIPIKRDLSPIALEKFRPSSKPHPVCVSSIDNLLREGVQ